MGIPPLVLDELQGFMRRGILPPGGSVAEIGSQEIHCHDDPSAVRRLLQAGGAGADDDLTARLARGGGARELFTLMGFRYASFDIDACGRETMGYLATTGGITSHGAGLDVGIRGEVVWNTVDRSLGGLALGQQLLRDGQGYGGVQSHAEASFTLHADATRGKQRHGRSVCEGLQMGQCQYS